MNYDFQNAVIKVVGVGGGGCNAVNHMIAHNIDDVEFYCLNTDIQALRKSQCPQENILQIGAKNTHGLGAGANPNKGREAAEENIEEIRELLSDADMVFIAAGMGGGTGTGAAPVVAQLAREMDKLVIGVVTKPFSFESNKRMYFAEQGIGELRKYVDSLIVIPNQKLMERLPKNIPLTAAFAAVNDVLHVAVKGVSDLILKEGYVNIDFADINTVMTNSGLAMMGRGEGTGEDRALHAVKSAISSPLLDDIKIENASGIIVSISSGLDITLEELEIIGEEISKLAREDAVVVLGNTFEDGLTDELHVSVIATGLTSVNEEVAEEKPVSAIKVTSRNLQQPTQTKPVQEKPSESLRVPDFLRQRSE
ncbi:cell division protein FtsZ [Vibrio sp. D431a]|uniref:cell division protein FtsZ n=1 Tax=Vibrio sp. D431a TaxID=2837388 RepID=UPI00255388CA|nr:cell division protein FtsZ [Vibrio sp. D431a]MDK9793809.1 cell division protein FtsZ [Vibrio sp. D431a]